MIWTTTLGFLVFGDVPHRWTIVGGLIVISSGLYLLHRERVRKVASKVEPSRPLPREQPRAALSCGRRKKD